jgi:hypothetical protein
LLATSIALFGAVTSAKVFEYFSNLSSKKGVKNGN